MALTDPAPLTVGCTVAVATSPVRPAELTWGEIIMSCFSQEDWLTWLVGSTTAWVVARWAIGRMEAV